MKFPRIVRFSGCVVVMGVIGCNGSDVVQPSPEPAPSAVYNQIIFESDRDDANGDLYLMNLDGSNVRRFASSSFADGCPAFSPDGTRIAFYSARLGNQLSIFVMHSDGRLLRFIDGPVSSGECPHWAADGKSIGYVRDDRAKSLSYGVIRVASADGSDVRTVDSAARFVGPVLSPTGDRIVYYRFDQSTDTLRSGVFVAGTAGGAKQRIGSSTIDYRTDANLDWSKDGTLVLFGCLVSTPFHFGVCISRPDGSGREVIPYPFDFGNFQYARFSPDASFLVTANLDVSVMPRSGSPRTYLHDGSTPTWLSDGSAVGFVSPPKFPDPEPYNPADIFVGNRDGSGVRNLTKHPARDVHPSWSPIQR
ncbi:MAG: PD40 domain-containing protein [Gemmatimonadaceae bacterium]|nr:PD40 domain-containing protein [Gemmatimonadaceae bacterium]